MFLVPHIRLHRPLLDLLITGTYAFRTLGNMAAAVALLERSDKQTNKVVICPLLID